MATGGKKNGEAFLLFACFVFIDKVFIMIQNLDAGFCTMKTWCKQHSCGSTVQIQFSLGFIQKNDDAEQFYRNHVVLMY